jgi:hypothetical protein
MPCPGERGYEPDEDAKAALPPTRLNAVATPVAARGLLRRRLMRNRWLRRWS